MKIAKNFKRIVACIVAFALVFTCIGAALSTVSAAEDRVVTNGNGNATDVGTWYTTYNCDEFWAHRFANPETSAVGYDSLLPDGTYGVPFSGNTDIIDFQIEQMAKAGIDFIIFDITNGGLSAELDGTSSNRVQNWIVDNAKLTIERIAVWNANHTWKLKYAVAAGAYKSVCNGKTVGEASELQAAGVLEKFVNDAEYGSDYYMFDGKPLLVLYNWTSITTEDATVIGYINDSSSSLSKFTVRSAAAGAAGTYGWFNTNGVAVYDDEVVFVSPGHYNASAGTVVSIYADADTHRTHYQDNWENVILANASTPRVVIVGGINDYMEGNAIFPTKTTRVNESAGEEKWYNANGEEDPYLFWDMTVDYLAQLRAKNAELGYTSVTPDTSYANVALGATVTGNQLGSFALSNATDGVYNVNGTGTSDSAIVQFGTENVRYFNVDFGAEKTINNVTLKYASAEASTRPRDIAVDVYTNGEWKRVAEIHAAAGEDIWATYGNVIRFNFEAVDCTAFRVTGNKVGAGSGNFRVNEIEAYNNPTITSKDYTGIEAATVAGTEIPLYVTLKNYALTANVTANSHNQDAAGPIANINDGSTSNRSLTYGSNQSDNVVKLDFTFDSAKIVNTVNLYADSNEATKYAFRDIAVEVMLEDGNWKRVAEAHALSITANSQKYTVTFAPVETTVVRVLCDTSLQTSKTFASFAEIEIFNNPDVTEENYTGITASTEDEAVIAAVVSDNYALNCNVSTSAFQRTLASNFPLSRVTDGSTGSSMYAYFSDTNNANYSQNHYIQVDFGTTRNINEVVFVACNQEGKFVNDYAVDVLLPDGRWQRVATRYYDGEAFVTTKAQRVVFTFEDVSTTAIRVYVDVTHHSDILGDSSISPLTRILSCTEIEAYYVSSATPYTGVDTSEAALIPLSNSDNHALTATVTTNSTNVAAGPLTDINNGEIAGRSLTRGWNVEDNIVKIDFTFDSAKAVNTVNLYADQFEANKYNIRDIAIDVRLTDGTWKRVAEEHALSITTALQKHTITFESVEATVVRVLCDTSLQTSEDYASFAEIEIYYNLNVTEENYTGVIASTEDATVIALPLSDNYALTATVTTDSSNNDAAGELANINNGSTSDRSLTFADAARGHADNHIKIDFKFDSAKKINTVNLYADNLEVASYAFRDIAVDVLTAEGTWDRVAEVHALNITSNSQKYTVTFAPVETTMVRVHCDTSLQANATYASFAEIEIFNNHNVTVADYTGIRTSDEEETIIPADTTAVIVSENFALGQKVTSSNTDWSSYLYDYPASRLTDGVFTSSDVADCAISNYVNGMASFTVHFDAAHAINVVKLGLSPQQNALRPDEYIIEVDTEDGWVRVASAASTTASSMTFYFETIECTAVRVIANNKLNANSSPNFRILELEAYYALNVTEAIYTGFETTLGPAFLANVQGDVDGNTWVNAIDLAYATNWYVQARPRVESNAQLMDTNRDGKYDIRDYLYIVELLATRDFKLM